MSPDSKIRELLPKQADGESLAFGTFEITVYLKGEPFAVRKMFEIQVPDPFEPDRQVTD